MLFAVLSVSICSIAVQAHWTDGISKNDREAFCNFYARLEGFLTNLELGASAESLRFCYNRVVANVSRRFRKKFHKKWNRVAHKKNLGLKKEKLYKACLRNSSSPKGRKKCQLLVERHLENMKEALIATLAKAEKKGTRICNKIEMVSRYRRR